MCSWCVATRLNIIMFYLKTKETHKNTDSRPSHFQPRSPSCATHSPQSHPGTPLPQWGLIPSHLQKYHVIFFFLEALFFCARSRREKYGHLVQLLCYISLISGGIQTSNPYACTIHTRTCGCQNTPCMLSEFPHLLLK